MTKNLIVVTTIKHMHCMFKFMYREICTSVSDFTLHINPCEAKPVFVQKRCSLAFINPP